MARVKIGKEYTWEMGHRLPGHPVCQNVHGHSYRLVVEVEGEPDETGMVIDYGEISCIVKPLLAKLDHSFMVDPDDALMRGLLDESGLKATPVPFRSTAENIATWFLEQVKPRLFERPGVDSVTLTVYETARTFARVSAQRA